MDRRRLTNKNGNLIQFVVSLKHNQQKYNLFFRRILTFLEIYLENVDFIHYIIIIRVLSGLTGKEPVTGKIFHLTFLVMNSGLVVRL